MALTYIWKLTSLKKLSNESVQDAIVQTHWKLTGTDENGNTGVFDGATPFDHTNIDPNNFTSYGNLTEEMVLEWIKAVVVGDYWKHVEGRIQKQIDAKKNSVTEVQEHEMPWAPPPSANNTFVDPAANPTP